MKGKINDWQERRKKIKKGKKLRKKTKFITDKILILSMRF